MDIFFSFLFWIMVIVVLLISLPILFSIAIFSLGNFLEWLDK